MKAFIHKISAGFIGGLTGSLAAFIIFLFTSKIVQPVFTSEVRAADFHPGFIYILMGMLLLATVSANIAVAALMPQTSKKAVFENIAINVVIFLMMFPVYLISNYLNFGALMFVIATHLFLTIQSTILLYEMSPVGIYSGIFGLFTSTALFFLLAEFVHSSITLFFASFPLIWTTFMAVYTFVEWVGKKYSRL